MSGNISPLEGKYKYSEYLLQLAKTGAQTLNVHDSLELMRKSIKSFPRVKEGVPFLLNYCSNFFIPDIFKKEVGQLNFGKGELSFALAVLSLSGYNYREINRLIQQNSKITSKERTDLADTKKICSLLYNSNRKKELYRMLRSKMNPYIAAVLTITASNNLNPDIKLQIKTRNDLEEKILLREIEELQETLHKQTVEYEDLKKRYELLKVKLAEPRVTIIKQSHKIKIPAALQAVLS